MSVVIATRDRPEELARTLRQLARLNGDPPVLVVDNASAADTAAVVAAHPGARLVPLPVNLGAAARTVGARLAATPFVAFADDDSWWDPDALERAVAVFDADPSVALVAGRVLVGEDEQVDPVSTAMAEGTVDEDLRRSPTGRRTVTGFLACGAVVRRNPFLAVGGFAPRLGTGGEEELMALDLLAAGFKAVYAPDVVAHHHPSVRRQSAVRRRRQLRNRLVTAWARYSAGLAVRSTLDAARPEVLWRHPGAVIDAVRSASWVAEQRFRLPGPVEAAVVAHRGVDRALA